jgi:hypothetical protein
VLAPARYAAERRIGLAAAPGGFGTPDGRLRVRRGDLVVGGAAAPLTTLAEAAERAGVEPGRHTGTYAPVTPWRPDQPLLVDAGDAAALAAWFALGDDVLRGLGGDVTLWPEHLDIATSLDARVNVGLSPGDDDHPLPYAYVGPWDLGVVGTDPFWNEAWGASLPWSPSTGATEVEAFVADGLGRL